MNSNLMQSKSARRPSASRLAASLVALVVAMLLVSTGAEAGQATQFQINGKVLKTKPANGARISPLVDAIFSYDQAVEANGGKAPADAAQRLQKMQSLVPQAKSEIRSFVGRLKAAGELDAFNAYIEAKAKETGSAQLMSELRAAGNASQLLLGADAAIDKDIKARQQAISTASLLLNGLLDLVSVRSAHASFRSGVCSGFWFVLSWGYADQIAYKSCYQ